MSLTRMMIPEEYVFDVFGAVCCEESLEYMCAECIDAFQELEKYFVDNICGGSEQFAWTLMNALHHKANKGEPSNIESRVRLRNKANTQNTDEFYIEYIGTILALYESINDDVLVANYQYRMSDDTIDAILTNYEVITTSYATNIYYNAKEVFSGFINTSVLSVEETMSMIYDYYESCNNLELDDEYVIKDAIANYDHHKVLIYLAKVCRENALDELEYLESIKLNCV